MSIKKFLEVFEETNFGGCCVLLSDSTNLKWKVVDNEITWKDEQGAFYKEWLPEGIQHTEDGYAVANVDTGCGQWVTNIFLMSNYDEDLSEDEEELDDEE